MPVFDLAEILVFVGNLLREAFKFVILKMVLISAAMLILPWCIQQGWELITAAVSSLVSTALNSQTGFQKSPVLMATGFMGFLFECFRLSEVFSTIFSGCLIAFTIRRIKI